ncbi:MAG: hypothetical protein IPN07_07100 [Dehalococcoidia bacterium]|nr:hypothetical protein [Dehalococcoidia bacterium]
METTAGLIATLSRERVAAELDKLLRGAADGRVPSGGRAHALRCRTVDNWL